MDKLRLRFEKTGRAVYISHLDLMHTMQRAFLRAGLPLAYSEGFNPHAQISIILPLSVGMESVCELMDFRLREDVELAKIPPLLTDSLPEGITALEAYPMERKGKELKWISVRGVFEYDTADPEKMAAGLRELFAGESLVITKKSKKGMGESDIRPAIHSVRFTPDAGGVIVDAVVSAQEPTLNPEHLATAARQLMPECAPDFAEFRRIEVFDKDFKVFR